VILLFVWVGRGLFASSDLGLLFGLVVEFVGGVFELCGGEGMWCEGFLVWCVGVVGGVLLCAWCGVWVWWWAGV
jgi:hypothetical protein